MNRIFFLCLIYFLVSCALRETAGAQQHATVLPEGTLLHCTLDEPHFSPTTASIDDPVLCHIDAFQQIDRGLPRDSYLGGRLVGARQPGHFVGKGSMTLVFDRIGFGNSEQPLLGKVIAVHGYNVTREGTIKGGGHTKRDAIEWMVPMLWPWKILTLPARGPQPVLKGEVRVTLRVMDDLLPLQAIASPTPISMPHAYQGRGGSTSLTAKPVLTMGAASSRLEPVLTGDLRSLGELTPHHLITLLALRSGQIYAVSDYWLRDDDISLAYKIMGGATHTIDLKELDWTSTTKLNEQRGVHFMIRREELLNR